MSENSELMTIKEFAEASGRSQQTIYKQIATRLSAYLHEIDGQKFIERKALVEVFQVGVQPKDNNSFNLENNPNNPLYDILKAELDAKNRQIEQLQTELAEERKHAREQADKLAQLADQAQRLHAGSMQQALPGTTTEEIEAVEAAQSAVTPATDEMTQGVAGDAQRAAEELQVAPGGTLVDPGSLSWIEWIRVRRKKKKEDRKKSKE